MIESKTCLAPTKTLPDTLEESMSKNAVKRLYLMQVGSVPEYQIPIVCYLVQTGDGKNILIDSGLPEIIPEGESGFENGAGRDRAVGEHRPEAGRYRNSYFDALRWRPCRTTRGVREGALCGAACASPKCGEQPTICCHSTSMGSANGAHSAGGRGHRTAAGAGADRDERACAGASIVLVRLHKTGTVLLTIDAVPFGAGFTRDKQDDGSDLDAAAIRASTHKLLDLVEREQVGLVIFGHEWEQWEGLKKLPEYYE